MDIHKSLSTLINLGFDFSHIIDVGVNSETAVLKSLFPDAHHYLIEPMSEMWEQIEDNYRNVQHTLIKKAAGNRFAETVLVKSSITGSSFTHSQAIGVERLQPLDGNSGSFQNCEIVRVDGIGLELGKALLKIDVDGQDLEVLAGSEGVLDNIPLIILETTVQRLERSLQLLGQFGYTIHQFVDIVSYGPSLYQLDIIALREDCVTDLIRPPIHPFDKNQWKK